MADTLSKYEAYPGDEYIKRCRRAERAKYTFISICIIGMVVGFFADIVNLYQTFDIAFAFDEEKLNAYTGFMRQFMLNLPLVLAITVSIAYLVAGAISGNVFRLYKSRHNKFYFLIFLVVTTIMIAVLVLVTIVRLSTEIQTELQGDGDILKAIFLPILLTTAMLIGAAASWVYGYFQKNAVAEAIAIEARKHYYDDAELYDNCKQNYVKEHFNRGKLNNDLDAINEDIRFHFKASQESRIKLLMVKNDPGEAKDVLEFAEKAEQMIKNAVKESREYGTN